jgi:RNA polymerase sigma-70 factor (family 1)
MLSHQIYIKDRHLPFKEVFRQYYPSLVHFAFTILKKKHDAEDVVQDVFLNIWRVKPTFENEIAFKAYIYLSTRNRAIDALKKKKPLYKDTLLFEDIEQEIDSVSKEEAFRLLDASIDLLPKRSRQIIRLSAQGLSVKEVSVQLNITINTVKTLKLRAYKFLKENCLKVYATTTMLLLLFF